MIRSVLDTNVVLSALLWSGRARQLFASRRSGTIEFYSSPALLEEFVNVLSRSKFDRRVASSKLSRPQIVALYSTVSTLVDPLPVIGIAPDPDDDVVLGTALAARANLIVTGDTPLLSVESYEGVRIVSVAEALRLIEPA